MEEWKDIEGWEGKYQVSNYGDIKRLERDIIFIFQGDICTMTLDEVHVNQSAVITKVGGEGVLRGRLLDMGLIPKTAVTVIKYAPMGDPIEIRLRGYELTIRKDDAKMIEVNAL